MKVNPVFKRENMVSARNFRLALILLGFNGILAIVALLNMYSVIAQVRISASIQYSSFLQIYIFVAAIEFGLLMFIMPAITAGSISGERERKTLDLMLTTQMTPLQIVSGKLMSAFSTLFVLIITSFPILALVFVYGGITMIDVAMLMLCYVTVALFTGSLGIFFSVLLRKSTVATVVTYSVLAVIVAGTYAVNQFSYSMSRMYLDNTHLAEMSAQQADSGNALYLLLVNPAVTFHVMLNKQAGDNQVLSNLGGWFGSHPTGFVIEHWLAISIVIQLVAAFILLAAAVKLLDPVQRKHR